VLVACFQAECLVETQASVYERFRSGMMAKEKKQDDESEEEDGEDHQDEPRRSSNTICRFLGVFLNS